MSSKDLLTVISISLLQLTSIMSLLKDTLEGLHGIMRDRDTLEGLHGIMRDRDTLKDYMRL